MGRYIWAGVDLHRRLGRSLVVPDCDCAIGTVDNDELVCRDEVPDTDGDDFVAVDPGFDPSRSPRPRL
jgi:hypothetical protein